MDKDSGLRSGFQSVNLKKKEWEKRSYKNIKLGSILLTTVLNVGISHILSNTYGETLHFCS